MMDRQSSTYRIDAEQTVVMGLPPPEIDSVVSWRNYGLAHSIRDVYLKVCDLANKLPPYPSLRLDNVHRFSLIAGSLPNSL